MQILGQLENSCYTDADPTEFIETLNLVFSFKNETKGEVESSLPI